MTDFAHWLGNEIKKREWSRYKLSKISGVDSGYITRILNREQPRPGPDVLISIARALNLPREMIFRKAGYLDPEPNQNPHSEVINYLLSHLPEDDQEEIVEFARLKLRIREQRENYDT